MTDKPGKTLKIQIGCHRLQHLIVNVYCLPLVQQVSHTTIDSKMDLFKFEYKYGKELTLKVPITTAADDNFFYFIFFYFSEKTSLDISCESSAWQTIHLKCQDLFSLKNKKKIMSSATNFAWRCKG